MDMSFYGKTEEGIPLLAENVTNGNSSETPSTGTSFSTGKVLLLMLSLSAISVALLSVFSHQSSKTIADMQNLQVQPDVPHIFSESSEEADFFRRPYVPGSVEFDEYRFLLYFLFIYLFIF